MGPDGPTNSRFSRQHAFDDSQIDTRVVLRSSYPRIINPYADGPTSRGLYPTAEDTGLPKLIKAYCTTSLSATRLASILIGISLLVYFNYFDLSLAELQTYDFSTEKLTDEEKLQQSLFTEALNRAKEHRLNNPAYRALEDGSLGDKILKQIPARVEFCQSKYEWTVDRLTDHYSEKYLKSLSPERRDFGQKLGRRVVELGVQAKERWEGMRGPRGPGEATGQNSPGVWWRWEYQKQLEDGFCRVLMVRDGEKTTGRGIRKRANTKHLDPQETQDKDGPLSQHWLQEYAAFHAAVIARQEAGADHGDGAQAVLGVTTHGGLGAQLNGLMLGLVLAAVNERALVADWHFASEFGSPHINVTHDGLLERVREDGEELPQGHLEDSRALFHALQVRPVKTYSDDGHDLLWMRAAEDDSLCLGLYKDTQMRPEVLHATGLEYHTWRQVAHALTIREGVDEPFRFWERVSKRGKQKGFAHSMCRLLESCALRYLIGRPTPPLAAALAPHRHTFSDCSTAVVGMYIRLGDKYMEAEDRSRFREEHEVYKLTTQHLVEDMKASKARFPKRAVPLVFEWAARVADEMVQATHLQYKQARFFLATDSAAVVDMARERFGAGLVLAEGSPAHTVLDPGGEARRKAALDFWLLTQTDAVVQGGDSAFVDKALLTAMHTPVIVRCKGTWEWQHQHSHSGGYNKWVINENPHINKELTVNVTVDGYRCRYVQMMDRTDGLGPTPQ